MAPSYAMKSFEFVMSNDVTPLSLVTECTNENAIEIAKALLKSIPTMAFIESDKKDINDLLKVAIRKSVTSLIDLIFEMDFDPDSYFKQNKSEVNMLLIKQPLLYKRNFQNKEVLSLKSTARLVIRSHIGYLDSSCCSYKPSNCYDCKNCNSIVKAKTLLRKLRNLSLPETLISYITFDF
jgi:hypothetical protein